MTILVAYVPRPEGLAALQKGLEMAKQQSVRLLVVNASSGSGGNDTTLADSNEIERVEKLLSSSGVDAEFKQFVRGKDVVAEIETLVNGLDINLVIIGLRQRSAVGKLLMGSVAHEILMTILCPILAVKAY